MIGSLLSKIALMNAEQEKTNLKCENEQSAR